MCACVSAWILKDLQYLRPSWFKEQNSASWKTNQGLSYTESESCHNKTALNCNVYIQQFSRSSSCNWGPFIKASLRQKMWMGKGKKDTGLERDMSLSVLDPQRRQLQWAWHQPCSQSVRFRQEERKGGRNTHHHCTLRWRMCCLLSAWCTRLFVIWAGSVGTRLAGPLFQRRFPDLPVEGAGSQAVSQTHLSVIRSSAGGYKDATDCLRAVCDRWLRFGRR